MFYENPIVGVGFKNFPWNVNEYESPEQKARVGRSYAGMAVHSVYFAILAELGLCGAAIFAVILGYNIRDLRRIIQWSVEWKKYRPPDDRMRRDVDRAVSYGRAMQASLVGFLVSGIFLSAFDYPHFWILTALIVALKEIVARELKRADGTLVPTLPRDGVGFPSIPGVV